MIRLVLQRSRLAILWKFVKDNEMVKVALITARYSQSSHRFKSLRLLRQSQDLQGNTAQGATKPATVETGAQVQVPLFVNQGDKLKIDTRTGEYLSRV